MLKLTLNDEVGTIQNKQLLFPARMKAEVLHLHGEIAGGYLGLKKLIERENHLLGQPEI